MEEDDLCPECEEGAGWLATFADLMSLLMCFFVLLLSFSEMDVQKYKRVAGSMSNAFGVQRDVRAKEIPKGTSIIAKEFSPGKPTPTSVPQVRQMTTQEMKQNLDFSDTNDKFNQKKDKGQGRANIEGDQSRRGAGSADKKGSPTSGSNKRKGEQRATHQRARAVRRALKTEIAKGLIQVKIKGNRVVVSIRERGFFSAGQSQMNPAFAPVLKKIADVITKLGGRVLVAGHTDALPIKTQRFGSNWELSASRAASVVHFMTDKGSVDPKTVEIRAFADTKPVAPNDNALGRAQNRRVEVILLGNTE